MGLGHDLLSFSYFSLRCCPFSFDVETFATYSTLQRCIKQTALEKTRNSGGACPWRYLSWNSSILRCFYLTCCISVFLSLIAFAVLDSRVQIWRPCTPWAPCVFQVHCKLAALVYYCCSCIHAALTYQQLGGPIGLVMVFMYVNLPALAFHKHKQGPLSETNFSQPLFI